MSDFAANSALIASELTLAKNIYVELGFIQQLYIGRLLGSGIKDRPSYNRLVQFVYNDSFKYRYTDDLSKLIEVIPGDISVTDRNVMMLSPFTSGIELVAAFIILCRENAVIAFPDDKNPINIILNCSDVPDIDDDTKEQVKYDLEERFNAKVIISTRKVEDYTNEEMLRYDAYFINDLARFNDKFIKQLDELLFIQKHVFGQKLISGKLYDKFIQRDPDEVFREILVIMSAACSFNFLQESKIVDS